MAGTRAARTAPRTAPLSADEIRQEVAAVLGVPPGTIPDDAHLVHLGIGSLELMRLITRWRRCGLPAEFAELAAAPTLDAWHHHLTAAWNARAEEVA